MPNNLSTRLFLLIFGLHGLLLLSVSSPTQEAPLPPQAREMTVTLSAASPTHTEPVSSPAPRPVPSNPPAPTRSQPSPSTPAAPIPEPASQSSPAQASNPQPSSSTSGSSTNGAALSQPRFDSAALNNPPPIYPPVSRRTGEEGRVLLTVWVGPDGLPKSIAVSHSSGSERLDLAAQKAIWKWRFMPALLHGEPVSATVNVPISFKLD